jgi:hypothetical protein
MMWIIKRIYEIFSKDNIDDYLVDFDIKEKDKKYNFPILRSQAIEIADRNENLKTDFCRNSDRSNISFLCFSKWKINVVKLNGKKYWQIQILGGDVSGIEFLEDGTKYWDGHFLEKDLKLLRCLIDVENGEYIYYPDESKKMKWRDIMKEMEEMNVTDETEELEEKEKVDEKNNQKIDWYSTITEEELDRREKYQKENEYSILDLIDAMIGTDEEDKENDE